VGPTTVVSSESSTQPGTTGTATTTRPPATGSDESSTGNEPKQFCDASEENLSVNLQVEGDWPSDPLHLDTMCVVEDDGHDGQVLQYLLHCEVDGTESPLVVRIAVGWAVEVRRPMTDGERVRLRATVGTAENFTIYKVVAVHGEDGELRVGRYYWPLPARLGNDESLSWLGIEVALLEDECSHVEPEDDGNFLADPCASERTPLAVALRYGDDEITLANRNFGTLGPLGLTVFARHTEWLDQDCGSDDVYGFAVSGPDRAPR